MQNLFHVNEKRKLSDTKDVILSSLLLNSIAKFEQVNASLGLTQFLHGVD